MSLNPGFQGAQHQIAQSRAPMITAAALELRNEALIVSCMALFAIGSILLWGPLLVALQLLCFWPLWLLSASVADRLLLQLAWLPFAALLISFSLNLFFPITGQEPFWKKISVWAVWEDFKLGMRAAGMTAASAITGLIVALGLTVWVAGIYLWPLWAVPGWSVLQRLIAAPIWLTIALSVAATLRVRAAPANNP